MTEIAIINESESDSSFEEDCFELANLSQLAVEPCIQDTAMTRLDSVLNSIDVNATVTSSIRIENGVRVLLNVNIDF